MFMTFQRLMTVQKKPNFYFTERLVFNGMTALKLSGELKGRNTLGGKTKILSYAR
jgi:hypothetical protein